MTKVKVAFCVTCNYSRTFMMIKTKHSEKWKCRECGNTLSSSQKSQKDLKRG